ncbi:MAG: hypothetical protein U1F56_15500 [Rubrivivax sp.]
MERLAILVNDSDHAAPLLQPLLAGPEAGACTLVLCPPRLTHRVGKWLSNRQRLQWQRTWSEGVRRSLEQALPDLASRPTDWVTSGTRLTDTTARLRRRLGVGLRVLDLRRPTLGHTLPPADGTQTAPAEERWTAPVAVTSGLALMLTLVD